MQRARPELRILASFGLAYFLLLSARGEVSISAHPVSRLDVLTGSQVVFNVQATGDGPLRYQWRRNGVNISGATAASYLIPSVLPRHGGRYSVAVGDQTGFVTSDEARLTLQILPRAVANGVFAGRFSLVANGVLRSDNIEAVREAGEPFHAGKRGGKSLWFQWTAPPLLGGIVTFSTEGSGFDTLLAAYTGGSLATLEPVPGGASDDERDGFLTSRIRFNAGAGKTYVIAVDGFAGAVGDVTLSWDFEASLDLLPEITFMSPGQTVTLGERVELFFGSNRGDGEWYFNDQPTGVTDGQFVIENADESNVGLYSVRIRSGLFRLVETPAANIQVHYRSDGSTDPGSMTSTKFLEIADRIRELQPVEPQAFQPKPILPMSNGPSSGYSSTQIFSTYGSFKEPEEPNHCGEAGGASEWHSYQAPEDGTLLITTEGSNFDTVLAIYTGPGTDFDSLIAEGCDNQPGNGGERVLLPAIRDRIYYIAVDGVNGSKGTVKLEVHLGAPVEIARLPASTEAPLGTPAGFSVEATGSERLFYQWFHDDSVIPGATNVTYVIPKALDVHAGNYTVVVSNLINSVTSAPPAVLTLIRPPAIQEHPEGFTAGVGEPAWFSVVADGTPPLSYRWRRGSDFIGGATEASFEIESATLMDAGMYSVVISNAAGTAESMGAHLTVNMAPEIQIHPMSTTAAPGGPVTLSVAAVGSPPPQYQWQFKEGDLFGQTAAILEITNFMAAHQGDYRVRVWNSLGSVLSEPALLLLNSPLRVEEFALGEGGLELYVIGTAETAYWIDASTNLVFWEPVFTNQPPTGFFRWTDTNGMGGGGGYPLRFYRVRPAP